MTVYVLFKGDDFMGCATSKARMLLMIKDVIGIAVTHYDAQALISRLDGGWRIKEYYDSNSLSTGPNRGERRRGFIA